MAIAATPITHIGNLYDLLRQIVPPPEKAGELYRRLLAINELSGSMNSARDVDSVIHSLAAYFLEYLPTDPVRLCILDGADYRRIHLSGPGSAPDNLPTYPADGIAGSVMKSGMPLWIPDTHSTRKLRKFSGIAADLSAH